MKKLFFAIYFIVVGMQSFSAMAATHQMRNQMEFEQYKANQNNKMSIKEAQKDIPMSSEEFIRYMRERSKKVEVMPLEVVQNASSMNIMDDSQYISDQNKELSTFEQIYQSAMERLEVMEQGQPQDLINSPAVSDNPKAPKAITSEPQTSKKQISVVKVLLPNGNTIMAPAREHIPYLASRIEIMPNSMIRIVETVSLIANGQKLKYGLTKALPKYSISREGQKNKTIPYLNSVRINGTDVPYKIKDAGDRYLIKSKDDFLLQPGIYTYEFDYMLDRKLLSYQDRKEFYWDVTGSFWNLVVSQAIATVRLPIDIKPLGTAMYTGYSQNLTDKYSTIAVDRKTNALGFTSTTQLYPGEGMHIIISIPKEGFMKADFGKKTAWFLEDYGDIIIALFGLSAILSAYWLSWKNMKENGEKTGGNLQQKPTMLRMLLSGKFDKISFGAFLLELFKRNLIDIKIEQGDFVLIQKSKNYASLSFLERKTLKQIFKNKTSSASFNRSNKIRLKRAYNLIEKDTIKNMKIFSLKLNSGYLFFSCAMLVLSELAMSWLHLNTWTAFSMLISGTLTLVFYVWLLYRSYRKKWLKWVVGFFSILIIAITFLIMSFYIHLISAILILAMIVSIFVYSKLFSKKDGLIKNTLEEADKFRNRLKNGAQAIILGREFKRQQANIYALEISSYYPKSEEIEQDYRLDVIKKINDLL